MKISQKLILGFLGTAILTGSLGVFNAQQQSQTAEELAQQQAQEVATLIGYFASHELELQKPNSQSQMLAHLQKSVQTIHQELHLDMEIVDRNKIILADVVARDIGTRLDQDVNNEVGKTILDGRPRTYLEKSLEYPNGIYQIVIPFKTSQGKMIGAVVLEYTPLYKAAKTTVHKSIVATLVIDLICGIFAFAVVYLVFRSILRSIKQLQQAVINLAQGKLGTRVSIHSRDEMSELATSFNKMAEDLQQSRVELVNTNEQLQIEVAERQHSEAELQQTLKYLQTTQLQLIQAEKMSSLGQLVAGVAHEINNPVNFIHANLSYVEKYSQDLINFIQLYQQYYPNPVREIQVLGEDIELAFVQEDLPKILNSMRVGTQRISQIVLSLRKFSRIDEAEFKAVDLHEGIDSTLLILQHRLAKKLDRPAIEVIKSYGNLPPVECYPGQLNQVFTNILVNAIDAIEEQLDSKQTYQEKKHDSGQITIRTSAVNSQWIQIVIADNGPGIPEHIQHQIFNPFFTTKAVGKGTGMGMSISYQIITERHRGKLECLSVLGKGTEFVIQIPIFQKADNALLSSSTLVAKA
jgi:signal transduction histidine kinase